MVKGKGFDLSKLKPLTKMKKAKAEAKLERTLEDVKGEILEKVRTYREMSRRNEKPKAGSKPWFKEIDGDYYIRASQGIQPIYLTGRKVSSNWYGPLNKSDVSPAFNALEEAIKKGAYDKQIQDAWNRSKKRKKKTKKK